MPLTIVRNYFEQWSQQRNRTEFQNDSISNKTVFVSEVPIILKSCENNFKYIFELSFN